VPAALLRALDEAVLQEREDQPGSRVTRSALVEMILWEGLRARQKRRRKKEQ
jgi:hypothetical protein